jgi:phosphomannomutase
MSKNKIILKKGVDVAQIFKTIKRKYRNNNMSTVDGLKIDFSEEWIHLRKSNTEPIIRVITEAKTQVSADDLAKKFINEIKQLF